MNTKLLFSVLLSLFLFSCSSDRAGEVPVNESDEVVVDSTTSNNYVPNSSNKTEDLNVKTTIELPNIFQVLRGIL